MLIGVTLTDFADGDVQRWIDLASLSALLFAGISGRNFSSRYFLYLALD
jgi:hypothetical protein